MGIDAKEVNDLDQALNYFNKGIEADSGNTDLLLQRGKLYKSINDLDKACSDFSRAYNLGHNEAKDEMKEICNN